MPDLLLLVLLIPSAVKVGFTVWVWYHIAVYIFSCIVALLEVVRVEDITMAVVAGVISALVMLGMGMLVVGMVVMILRQGRGRGVRPMMFG
jgi:hypothetical protein